MSDSIDLTKACFKYLEKHEKGFSDADILNTYRSFLAGFAFFKDRSEEKTYLMDNVFSSFLPYVASIMPSISFSVEKVEPKECPALYTASLNSFSGFDRSENKDINLFLTSLKQLLTVLNSVLIGFSQDPESHVS